MQSLQRSFSQRSPRTMRAQRARSPQPRCQQKSVKTGWLRKQGGNFKTWTNRWFVIRGDQMYYYTKEDEVKELGNIPLPGNKVVSHQHNIDEPGKFLFEVIPGRGQARVNAAHESYLIWANTKEERESWISAIHRVVYAPNGGGVFGQSLAETMMNERKRKTGRTVPKVVEDCVKYLTEHGMDLEGIFRLPGLNKTIKKLKWEYDTAEDIDLNRDDVDVNSVASLLKLYFRELPEPVIPFQYYEMFLTMGLKIEHGDPRAMGTIHTLLDQLPVDNYNLLKYLSEFLHEVSRHSVSNKMPAMNLALVFGPNILKADIDDPTLMMSTTDLTTKTIFIFVEKIDEVFIREIDERIAHHAHGKQENMLNVNYAYNSRTLNRPRSPLADEESETVTRRLPQSPLCGSLPRNEPPVGDLLKIDEPVPLSSSSSGDLLSPETGETRSLTSLSDLSDASTDSYSIKNRISVFEASGRVAYRSNSESRRSRRSHQIEKCQMVGQSGEPSSSDSSPSPEVMGKTDPWDGVSRNKSNSATSEGKPARPVPPKRLNRKNSVKDKDTKVDGTNSVQPLVDLDKSISSIESVGDEASAPEFQPIAPKRNSRKKQRNPSDASSETSEISLPEISLPSTTETSPCEEPSPSFGQIETNSSVSVKVDNNANEKLMLTISSLELALKEQEMKHNREMNDMKHKYENRQKKMEDIFKVKINELAKMLTDEKTAMAQTVERIVGVQAELQKYQMKYGPLEEEEEWRPMESNS